MPVKLLVFMSINSGTRLSSCCLSGQISFFGGIILNEGVNWLLKHILREPRPCAGEATSRLALFGAGIRCIKISSLKYTSHYVICSDAEH